MAGRFGRRSLLGGGAALGGGLLMGATVGEGVAGAVVTHGKGLHGISAAKPRRGGSLAIGVAREEVGFDPTTARFDATGFVYARTVFDPAGRPALGNDQGVWWLTQVWTS